MRVNWPEAVDEGLAITMALHRAARLLEERSAVTLAGFHLSRTEFEVLAVLRSYPQPHRLNPTLFYEAMLMSSGGLTKILKTLEARRLIRRLASESDGRSRPIELTAEGLQLAENAMRALRVAESSLLKGYETQSSTKGLAVALSALVAAAELDKGIVMQGRNT